MPDERKKIYVVQAEVEGRWIDTDHCATKQDAEDIAKARKDAKQETRIIERDA